MRFIVMLAVIVLFLIFIFSVNERVIFRFDDVWSAEAYNEHNYTLENLKLAVEQVQGKRIMFAVTPFVYDPRCNCELELDNGTIAFLKEQQLKGAEIAMHGYNHKCNIYDACEFDNENFDAYLKKLLAGKDFLEKHFGRMVYFVPPKNHAERDLKIALKYANLKLLDYGYDPVQEWFWFNMTFDWHGFSDYSGEKMIILHHNGVVLEDLKEFAEHVN